MRICQDHGCYLAYLLPRMHTRKAMCRHKSDILLGLICWMLFCENSHSIEIMTGEKNGRFKVSCFLREQSNIKNKPCDELVSSSLLLSHQRHLPSSCWPALMQQSISGQHGYSFCFWGIFKHAGANKQEVFIQVPEIFI